MLLSLASSVSHALTYKTTSIEEAVRKADLIVYVTVNQQETVTRAQPTQPDAPKRERLFTLNTAKVHQAIKGTASNTLIITQSGGTKAGLTSVIAGAPRLNVGERWVLFLRRSQRQGEEWIITGGVHGAKRIKVRESDRVEVLAQRVIHPRLKVINAPRRQLKLAPRSVKHLQKAKLQAHSQSKPKPQAEAQSKARLLSAYIDQLKTLVDRTQAPVNPTH
jgi:hypothetical protein